MRMLVCESLLESEKLQDIYEWRL